MADPSVVVVADLTPRLRSEILAVCQRAYGEDLAPALESFHEPTHVIRVVDGRLVSHALWIERWLVAGDSPPLRAAMSRRWRRSPRSDGRRSCGDICLP